MRYLSGKLGEYEDLKIIRDRVCDVERIPTVTRYQLRTAYNEARIEENIDILTSKEILDLSHSKPL
jgi:hypothetical protein